MQPGDELSLVAGPRDRRAVQARADVAVFTSAPLERPTELTGPLRAVLWLAAPAPDFDVVATVSWVEPGGRALHLSDGILRMSFRDGPQGGAPPLRADEPIRVTVELDPTSIALPAGTRLRLGDRRLVRASLRAPPGAARAAARARAARRGAPVAPGAAALLRPAGLTTITRPP